MNSCERVLTAFAHEEPDRVPAWCGASAEFWTKAKLDLGLDDYLYGRGICVIEWAEKALSILPPEYLLIEIDYLSDTERSFQMKPSGQRYLEIVSRLKQFSLSLDKD